ncbi:MAG: acyltransferase family protein [Synechococcaceae cyanobacterium]|nr:acyltransferase family protein [Synechococcaceae cyanobacterium]
MSRYRPEIDGLRAVAVLAVLINHLNPIWLPGGYLGVDLFFVISGAVVTGSLVTRPASTPRRFLMGFYARRFRRLLPALIVNIVVVALLFSALVNPGDSTFAPSLRTGLSALFGVANLYLLRQGSNYFATDNHFNPFLHTWSLGVEEQFYLVWPIVLLLCGLGRKTQPMVRQRLGWVSLILSLASLVSLAVLQARGQNDASFFLLSARFWELAAGALAWLVVSRRPQQPQPSASAWGSLALLTLFLVLLFSPESWRIAATLACVACSVGLLIMLRGETGPGRWLAKPGPLAIGLSSYSLYLWHWPVIVLARWSVGINRWTVLPILLLIGLLTWLSYQLECRFRLAGAKGQPASLGALIRYPALLLLAAGALALLSGPARGRLFLGERRHLTSDIANSRSIPGTTLDTEHCFEEPMTPLAAQFKDDACTLRRHPGQPTLYFEGDSHTGVLIPLAETLIGRGSVNSAFFSRGGCPIPWFTPWAMQRQSLERYQFCQEYSRRRLQDRMEDIQPGDRLVLASNLPSYMLDPDPKVRARSLTNYATAVQTLATKLQNRGAGLILFGPLPMFTNRPEVAVPMSLCQPEWFRRSGQPPAGCSATFVPRDDMVNHLRPLEELLSELEKKIPNLHVFRPFAALCPPHSRQCSTHRGDRMLFKDSNHLSREGVRVLEKPFLGFLNQHGLTHPAPRSPLSPAASPP